MKLILLPGLDGSGEFFEPFLDCYGWENARVIPLPQSGPQDYTTLTEYVLQRLPADEDYIVLAESFSGPVGARLAALAPLHMKGVIFVATFMTALSHWPVLMALLLPLKLLLMLPLTDRFYRFLILGPDASTATVTWFKRVIGQAPVAVIKARIRAIWALRWSGNSVSLPALYLQADDDRLIPAEKFSDFNQYFAQIRRVKVQGPHFLLQTRTQECANLIRAYAKTLQ